MNHTHLFTDGSITEDYVGDGIFSNQRSDTIRLPEQCSIFSAEAYAIKEALGVDCEGPIVVFSDSASVLAAVESGRSKHPWIQEIERVAVEWEAILCWIPGHTGIAGNEMADRRWRRRSFGICDPDPSKRRQSLDKKTNYHCVGEKVAWREEHVSPQNHTFRTPWNRPKQPIRSTNPHKT